LVPLLTVVTDMPTRTSGKVDRDALPWPLDDGVDDTEVSIPGLSETGRWLAREWTRALGTPVTGPDDDFFDSGGGSLSAAQLVSALRSRVPTITVADIYDNPTLGGLADRLEEFDPPAQVGGRVVTPVPLRAQLIQTVLGVPLAGVVGLRWLTWALLLTNVLALTARVPWAPRVSWWWVLAGWVLLITPLGRMGLTVAVARATLRRIRPGSYPRGGSVHLRLWFAEAFAAAAGADNLAGAPWMTHYARALGAQIGRDVDLHATPPITGMLTLRRGCAIEPEVDLSGHWLDGDVVHIGRVRVDARARVGTRSVLAPGTRVGQGAEVGAGSAVLGSVPPGELWTGSPAVFVGRAGPVGPDEAAPRGRSWVPMYAATAAGLAALPLISVLCGLAVLGLGVRDTSSPAQAWRGAAVWLVPSAVTMFVVLAVLILICVRLLSVGIVAGHHPVRSRIGWQVWTTERLMDEARTWLFPLYSSQATPTWLRALGARIAPNVEASTVLMLPSMTTVGEGAFLADDTMIGSYELGGGWLRVEPSRVGKRAFLGNSGMTAPGRRVPKHGLVAVLSAAPERAKAGTSWLGSPPMKLRRAATEVDTARTFEPAKRLRMMRGVVEALRVVPVIGAAGLGVAVLMALIDAVARWGIGGGVLAAAPVVLAASLSAALVATATKWLLVGRIEAGEHPLWSSFVWRSELADTFVETMTAPWFARFTAGTPALVWWLRSMGSRIGRGVWCETYWLPEADLVRIGDGASVNVGCVLQTHLFHDRVMSLDSVTLEAGATMGPHGVILPAAVVGAGTTIGPSALVLRGEQLPAGTRWTGNPIAPWAGEAAE
jgi:non-ribosomal peptide synthetase-like protein